MGTNYYVITKVSDETHKEILDKVGRRDYWGALELFPKQIHVGKSSHGWQFLFNHNNWEYFSILEELETFLADNTIEDEYGTPISAEDFWAQVNAKSDGIDGKEYYENWSKYNKDFATGEPLPKPSYIPSNYGEEIRFGLRFSTHVEFS